MTRNVLTPLFALAVVALAVTASHCQAAENEAKKTIVFVHGKASHGYGGHAYGPAFRMLARMLNDKVPAVDRRGRPGRRGPCRL